MWVVVEGREVGPGAGPGRKGGEWTDGAKSHRERRREDCPSTGSGLRQVMAIVETAILVS